MSNLGRGEKPSRTAVHPTRALGGREWVCRSTERQWPARSVAQGLTSFRDFMEGLAGRSWTDYVPAAWLQYSECGCRAGGRALAAGSRDVEGLPPAAHL